MSYLQTTLEDAWHPMKSPLDLCHQRHDNERTQAVVDHVLRPPLPSPSSTSAVATAIDTVAVPTLPPSQPTLKGSGPQPHQASSAGQGQAPKRVRPSRPSDQKQKLALKQLKALTRKRQAQPHVPLLRRHLATVFQQHPQGQQYVLRLQPQGWTSGWLMYLPHEPDQRWWLFDVEKQGFVPEACQWLPPSAPSDFLESSSAHSLLLQVSFSAQHRLCLVQDVIATQSRFVDEVFMPVRWQLLLSSLKSYGIGYASAPLKGMWPYRQTPYHTHLCGTPQSWQLHFAHYFYHTELAAAFQHFQHWCGQRKLEILQAFEVWYHPTMVPTLASQPLVWTHTQQPLFTLPVRMHTVTSDLSPPQFRLTPEQQSQVRGLCQVARHTTVSKGECVAYLADVNGPFTKVKFDTHVSKPRVKKPLVRYMTLRDGPEELGGGWEAAPRSPPARVKPMTLAVYVQSLQRLTHGPGAYAHSSPPLYLELLHNLT